MKIIHKIFILFLFFNFLLKIKSDSAWCWTKSMFNDPAFTLNTNNGYFNWGFCSIPNPSDQKIKYTISLKTSNTENSSTS